MPVCSKIASAQQGGSCSNVVHQSNYRHAMAKYVDVVDLDSDIDVDSDYTLGDTSSRASPALSDISDASSVMYVETVQGPKPSVSGFVNNKRELEDFELFDELDDYKDVKDHKVKPETKPPGVHTGPKQMLTDIQQAQMVILKDSGHSIREIADKVQCNYSTAKSFFRRRRVKTTEFIATLPGSSRARNVAQRALQSELDVKYKPEPNYGQSRYAGVKKDESP